MNVSLDMQDTRNTRK